MPVDIFLYDLLDFGGNIELTEPMTEEEAKKANEDLIYKEPRFLRWRKSYNQETDRGTLRHHEKRESK